MEAKIVPVTSLRPRLLKYVTRADRLGQEFVITKKGRPAAVLISYDEWESWRETVEIMADKKTMKRIQRSQAYFAGGGKGKTIEEVFGK